jgi:hypothetical protein
VLLMRKGSREREFLRLLRHDGQDVPSPNWLQRWLTWVMLLLL